MIQKITPFLWFDTEAEDAMNFYVSVFKNSKVLSVSRTPDNVPGDRAGKVLVASFEIEGQKFHAMNGGPTYKIDEAISFVVNCDTQEEIDYYWEKLTSNGGKEVQCGWLKDKYGFRWQIVPEIMHKLLQDPDRAKAARAMAAMMKMVKLDAARIEAAARG